MAETELDETGERTRPSIAIDITLGREPYDQAAHPAMLVKTAMMDGCTITTRTDLNIYWSGSERMSQRIKPEGTFLQDEDFHTQGNWEDK